jgi:hypothetical protein
MAYPMPKIEGKVAKPFSSLIFSKGGVEKSPLGEVLRREWDDMREMGKGKRREGFLEEQRVTKMKKAHVTWATTE